MLKLIERFMRACGYVPRKEYELLEQAMKGVSEEYVKQRDLAESLAREVAELKEGNDRLTAHLREAKNNQSDRINKLEETIGHVSVALEAVRRIAVAEQCRRKLEVFSNVQIGGKDVGLEP